MSIKTLTREEIQTRYKSLKQKQESLRVSISNLHDRLATKKAKLKEINIRCDKLEKYLYPGQYIARSKAEKFQKMARRILPKKLYEDLMKEALHND